MSKVSSITKNWSGVVREFKANYDKTPKQVKIIDLFLVYVTLTAIVQFVYCVLVGTFPFNAFLGGFTSCLGVGVLTVSLRAQVTNPPEFGGRHWCTAFSDYIFCCLVLFFVCVNFIG
eukprot:g1825.t1